MLVVHPASCCDVCLDPYSQSILNSPHAISCGHIFCLTCLRSLSPNACPLCRKSFFQDRIKKLHVANPPELDNAHQDAIIARANILLQRVALVSGEDTPEQDVVHVLTDVQDWLQSQPHDTNAHHMPLRAAVAALQRYKALQDQSIREKAEFRQLRHQLRHCRRTADHDSITSRAVEESLLSRIQELETEHASQLAQLHSELEILRNHNPRYRNPLPQPPQPLPFDRFPPFARPGPHSDPADPFLGHAVPYPAPPPRDISTHLNTDSHPSTSIRFPFQSSKPPTIHHPKAPEDPRSEEPWPCSHLPDTTRRPRLSSTHSHAADHQPKLNGATRSAHTVLGTAHSSRSIPRRVPSPTWVTRPIVEDRRSDDEREREQRRKERHRHSMHNVLYTNADPVTTDVSTAAAYVSGYGSGYETGYQLTSAPYACSSNSSERPFPLQEETHSPEHAADVLGEVGVHANVEDHPTPIARARPIPRRAVTITSVTNTVRTGRVSRSLSEIPLLDAPVGIGAVRRVPMQSVGQVLGLDVTGRLNGNNGGGGGSSHVSEGRAGLNDAQIRMPRPQGMVATGMDSPRSETTWGTGRTAGGDSMDRLGLVGLHNGGTGRDSSVLRRLESEEMRMSEVTPVVLPSAGSGDESILGLILEDGDGADYPVVNEERSRYRAPYSGSTPSSHMGGSSRQAQEEYRRASQPRAFVYENEEGSGSNGNGNALSLHFDGLLSLDEGGGSHRGVGGIRAYDGYGGYGRHCAEIVAPTPVVGGPNIVDLWANRT